MFKCFSLLFLISFSLVHAEVRELATMQDLCATIADIVDNGQLPVVVFDIDDTLVTTEQDLGSTAWFDYEVEKQSHDPEADKALVLQQLIALYSHVHNYTSLKTVEDDISTFIFVLQVLGIPCLALTARSTLIERTFEQLAELEIDLSLAALSTDDLVLSDNPLLPARYSQGIIFNGNNHKGETLLKYLSAINYQPDLVIYVDDKENHVRSVHDALEKAGIPCLSFRYSASDAAKKTFNPAQAQAQLDAFLLEHPLVPATA